MKKILVFIVMAIGMLSASAEGDRYVILEMTNGSAITLQSAGMEMTVSGDNLIVNGEDETATFLLSDLKSMRFSDTPSGMSHIVAENEEISVYTLDGQLKGNFKCANDALKELSVSGIYILKGKNTNLKIMIER